MTDRVPRTGETAARILLAATFALASLALARPSFAGGPAAPPGCKPLPPVEVQLVSLDDIGSGGVGRFALEVTPRVPAREVRVHWIRSSARLGWVSGDTLATRPATFTPSHTFHVALRLPETGIETLHAQVEVVAENGAIWRRGIGLALGPEAVRARGRLAPDGEGGQVLEFDAAPADQRREGTR